MVMRRPVTLVMWSATGVVIGVSLATATPDEPEAAAGSAAKVVAPAPAPGPAQPPAAVTVSGAVFNTGYGQLQVQITVLGRRITKADAVRYPRVSAREIEINDYAIPELERRTLLAQSAQVDTVSGATSTSAGYRRSLQSAIDAAHAAGAL